jgi:hypothetical protein
VAGFVQFDDVGDVLGVEPSAAHLDIPLLQVPGHRSTIDSEAVSEFVDAGAVPIGVHQVIELRWGEVSDPAVCLAVRPSVAASV